MTSAKLQIESAICAGKNKARLFYPSYVKTYLEKDVRDLLRIKNQMQFMKFMRLCAARVGSLFNAQEVANEVGVDGKTITHWLSVLQASYLVTLLPPYFENIPKRLVKTPKLYFNDPGLACYLLDIESPKQLDRDKMRGAIFENFIVMEAIKHRYNQGLEGGGSGGQRDRYADPKYSVPCPPHDPIIYYHPTCHEQQDAIPTQESITPSSVA